MISIICLCILLVIAAVTIQVMGLRFVARFSLNHDSPTLTHIILAILLLMCLHLFEITIFSGGIFIAHHVLHLGDFRGDREFTMMDYFQFSAETFTTVGYGDLYPVGPLRILSGFESLTGVLLVAWSGAFSYFTVQRLLGSK